jgi:hypothetical protein
MARADSLGAELDPTELAGYQIEQGKPDPGDASLFVRFFLFPHRDAEKSLAEGRPIYYDREYIEIVVPGDKDTTVNRPIRPGDAQRFPRQYTSFKAGEVDAQVGTPLSAWPMITRAQVEEMKYFKIYTVEQLAGLSDNLAQKFMGINRLKQKAKDYIEASKGSAATDQLREEIEGKDARIMALEQAVQELRAMAEAAAKPKKRKPKKDLEEPEEPEEPEQEEEEEEITDHSER